MRRRRKQGLSFYEKKEIVNTEILKEVALWILYTVVAVFIAFFAVYYFGDRISVIGTSMEPGLAHKRAECAGQPPVLSQYPLRKAE
jgi:signal peptidase I